jgi:hypothetical protein
MQPGQFNLKRAMLSMTLISVGVLGLSLWLPGRLDFRQWNMLSFVYTVCACTCFIWLGAGIGVLYGRVDVGTMFGFLAECLILFVIISMRA